MKRDLNWLKTKADIRIGCFDMVSMGYAIEMYNEDQVHIEKLEKEIASLKEQLVNAVEAGEFFSKYADCKKESWACRCSFCRDVDSSRKLREARQFLKNKTQARREK